MPCDLYDVIDAILRYPCFSTLPGRFDAAMQLLYSYGRSALDTIGTFEMEQDIYDFIDFCDSLKENSDERGLSSDIFTIWHDVACVVLSHYTEECLSIGTYGWEKHILGPIREEI